jgi:uncharacterized C2H2 Zn-finger protein
MCQIRLRDYPNYLEEERMADDCYEDAEEVVCCPKCDKRFKSQSGLRSHYGQMHRNDSNEKDAEEVFCCPKCDKRLKLTGLKIHYGRTHGGRLTDDYPHFNHNQTGDTASSPDIDNEFCDGDSDNQSCDGDTDGNTANLRNGKWTEEELAYAEAVKSSFHKGYLLDAPKGILLGEYLTKKLRCNIFRIRFKHKQLGLSAKKYTPKEEVTDETVRDREHIAKLYQSFLKSIEQNEWYGEDHPYFIILQHIDGRMEHLKTKLSDKKFETLEMLRGLAQKIIDSPTPDDEYYAEETIKAFVLEHLVDLDEKRYEEQITDAKRSGKFITMGDYVVDKIVASCKCGLRDILTRYDYQGKIQPDKVRQLLNAIDVPLEANGFKNIAKGGSGPAETRCKDDNLYPDTVYNRPAVVKLNIEVSRKERAPMERIAIMYLVLTTGGHCSNLQLVVKDSQFDGGVYIMFSKYETIADHFTAFGRQDRGIILPKGTKIVVNTPTSTIDSNNTETEAAAPTSAAAAGGVADEDAVLTTAVNMSVTAGENAPISGVQSSAVQVRTPRQDDFDFGSSQYDNCHEEEEEDGSDRVSPPNVAGFPYDDVVGQGVGNCDNHLFTPIGRKRGRSNQSNANNGPSPKIYQPTVSRQQLLNPPENALNHKLMAEAYAQNRQNALENYEGRIIGNLLRRGVVSLDEVEASQSTIEVVAKGKVKDCEFVEENFSHSQNDSILIESSILRKRSEN